MDPNQLHPETLAQNPTPQPLPSNEPPNEIEETKKISRKVLAIIFLIIIVFVPAAIFAYSKLKPVEYKSVPATQLQVPVSTPTPTPENIFENSTGGYSFKVPEGWTAVVLDGRTQNSLFGPNASTSSGLGGVEIVENQDSLEAFLQSGVDAQFSNETNIVVDGVSGIRHHYAGFPASGEAVVLFSNGKIYNMYINSEDQADINKFDQIISIFKFIEQAQPQPSASPSGEQVACTQEAKLCPDGYTYVSREGPNCEFAPCP